MKLPYRLMREFFCINHRLTGISGHPISPFVIVFRYVALKAGLCLTAINMESKTFLLAST